MVIIYMESVSSSPQCEKANAGSHCKITNFSQVSQETAQKNIRGSQTLLCSPRSGSGCAVVLEALDFLEALEELEKLDALEGLERLEELEKQKKTSPPRNRAPLVGASIKGSATL